MRSLVEGTPQQSTPDVELDEFTGGFDQSQIPDVDDILSKMGITRPQ